MGRGTRIRVGVPGPHLRGLQVSAAFTARCWPSSPKHRSAAGAKNGLSTPSASEQGVLMNHGWALANGATSRWAQPCEGQHPSQAPDAGLWDADKALMALAESDAFSPRRASLTRGVSRFRRPSPGGASGLR